MTPRGTERSEGRESIGLARKTAARVDILWTVVLLAMMLHVLSNVVSRAVANEPITGTIEYITYWYMPILALGGFVVAEGRREHTEARFLFDRLPEPVKRNVQVGADALKGALCLGLCLFGASFALKAYDLRQTEGVLGIPIWPVTFLVPSAFLLMTVQVAWKYHSGRWSKETDTEATADQKFA